MKNIDQIEFTNELLLSEAEIIAAGILSESDHMIAKEPQEFLDEYRTHGGISARVNGKIAGIIKLSLLDENLEILERGGLFVLPEYRKHGIGRKLIKELNQNFRNRAILSVTNVPSVKRINDDDENQKLVPRDELGALLPIIE